MIDYVVSLNPPKCRTGIPVRMQIIPTNMDGSLFFEAEIEKINIFLIESSFVDLGINFWNQWI